MNYKKGVININFPITLLIKKKGVLLYFIFLFCNTIIAQQNLDDYDRIVRKAKKEKKVLVLHFGAQWCSPCINNWKETNEQIYNYRFISTRSLQLNIDIDKFESAELVDKFGVVIFPTVLLFNPTSNKSVRLKGSISATYLDKQIAKILEFK